MATKLAEEEGASIRLIHVLDPSTSRAQVRSLEKFHEELGELVGVPTESRVVESEDLLAALTSEVDDVDLVIIGAPRGRHFFTDLIDRIVQRVAVPVLLVRVADRQERATLRSTFYRLVTNRIGRGDAEHRE
jgi:nucleotide-binding universal stress UspA family protein